MIAPFRGPSQRKSGRSRNDRLEIARRIVAATLLSRADEDRGPPVPAWQAWLFAGWMAIAAIIYGLSMAGTKLF
ncbi:MAG TPA: hypothetical protein VGN42_04120 [Pirellulales bacterium]|jgi:hypothetical protein|nr:hypothetical protein [Pirellulales bacterium]